MSLGSFGKTLLACHASLYRYARALCHDPMEAEELVQETYRRALSAKRRPSSPALEAVRPWLFTILRNRWYNEVRQRKQAVTQETAPDLVCFETPEHILARRFLQSEVRDALDALPHLYREVIVLREWESLSYAEIAALLECPIGTVMSRLARARNLLRQTLARMAPAAKGAVGS
jgi:RNA polymerase sigma-70 factor (ECF subfamily)